MPGVCDFRVDSPGLVFYPLRLDNIVMPTRLLPEERLRLQFKQPGFLEARTNLFVQPEFNIFPLLVGSSNETASSIVGYREVKAATWLDRSYGKFYASAGYNTQVENPFTYQGQLEPYLSTLIIAYPEVVGRFDFRDDRVHPHKGTYFSANFQYAGGSSAEMSAIENPTRVRAYVPVASKVTLATRASVGFLFPRNYGDIVQYHLDEDARPQSRGTHPPTFKPSSFEDFSGGPSSNRGYPTRGIAPHGVIPFLNPATASQQVATSCDHPEAMDFDRELCSVPIGGFTLWEFSAELRFQIVGPLAGAIFVDMGDVSERTADIRLGHLHLSTGFGARYDTPVGPIRLDVGYRVQPLQVLGFSKEDEVSQNDPVAGLPPSYSEFRWPSRLRNRRGILTMAHERGHPGRGFGDDSCWSCNGSRSR